MGLPGLPMRELVPVVDEDRDDETRDVFVEDLEAELDRLLEWARGERNQHDAGAYQVAGGQGMKKRGRW